MVNGDPGERRGSLIESIKADLLAGEWLPGDPLRPRELAARYDSSPPVVREALTRLTGERLVGSLQNRGFFVPTVSGDQYLDMVLLFRSLNHLAISLAIERGDVDWESDVVAAHHRLKRAAGTEKWRQAHGEYHNVLIRACGLPMLLDFTRQVSDAVRLYTPKDWVRSDEEVQNIADEDDQIMDAVLERDADRAVALIDRHFDRPLRPRGDSTSAVGSS